MHPASPTPSCRMPCLSLEGNRSKGSEGPLNKANPVVHRQAGPQALPGGWGGGAVGMARLIPISLSHCCLPVPIQQPTPPHETLVSHFCFLLYIQMQAPPGQAGTGSVTRSIVWLIPSLIMWFLDRGHGGTGEIRWALAWSVSLTQTLLTSPIECSRAHWRSPGYPQREQLGAHMSAAPGSCFYPPWGPERPIVPGDVQPISDGKACEGVQPGNICR